MAIDRGDVDIKRALKTAYNILAYADNTEAKLRRKLAERDYEADIIDEVVETVRASGALDEERMLVSKLNYLINTKKYGRRRVAADLRKLGFSRELVESVDWDDFDFIAACASQIKSRGGLDDKTFAALLRRGYLVSEIKAAAKIVDEE